MYSHEWLVEERPTDRDKKEISFEHYSVRRECPCRSVNQVNIDAVFRLEEQKTAKFTATIIIECRLTTR